jgi:hypothetical protein
VISNSTVIKPEIKHPNSTKKIKYRCSACKCMWRSKKRCATKDEKAILKTAEGVVDAVT